MSKESYKEETKLLIAKTIIMFERQLGEIEQDSWNNEISERERKGLEIEKAECINTILEAKKCFNWIDSISL